MDAHRLIVIRAADGFCLEVLDVLEVKSLLAGIPQESDAKNVR